MAPAKLRIWIDATTVTSQKDGLSQYIINLLQHLPAAALDTFAFTVLLNKNLQRPELFDAITQNRLAVIETTIAHIGPKRDWDMYWFLRKHRQSYDLFHSTSNQYPLVLKKGIATVHDITFKNYPRYFDGPRLRRKLAHWYQHLVIKTALQKAKAVIAVSDATRSDLLQHYNYIPSIAQKTKVVHEGWEHVACATDEVVQNLPQNYLLYVGSTRWHKNMYNLLVAFGEASKKIQQPLTLVLCGNKEKLSRRERALIATINADGEKVICKGFVTAGELHYLYSKANACILPSLAEGFGLPMLEAFYYQKPLLCSNTACFTEVAGNAALTFNPHDVADMTRVLVQYCEHPTIITALIAKGTEQLQRFSWIQMAASTVALYKKVLQVQDGATTPPISNPVYAAG